VTTRWPRLGAISLEPGPNVQAGGQYLRSRLRHLSGKLSAIATSCGKAGHGGILRWPPGPPHRWVGHKHRDPGELEPWADADSGHYRTATSLSTRQSTRRSTRRPPSQRQVAGPYSSGRKELALPGGVARYSWVPVVIDHEHPCGRRARWSLTTPAACSLPSRWLWTQRVTPLLVADHNRSLPSIMLHASYPVIWPTGRPAGVHIPFQPYPGVVCGCGFESLGLRKHPRVGLLAYVQRRHLFASLVMS